MLWPFVIIGQEPKWSSRSVIFPQELKDCEKNFWPLNWPFLAAKMEETFNNKTNFSETIFWSSQVSAKTFFGKIFDQNFGWKKWLFGWKKSSLSEKKSFLAEKIIFSRTKSFLINWKCRTFYNIIASLYFIQNIKYFPYISWIPTCSLDWNNIY